MGKQIKPIAAGISGLEWGLSPMHSISQMVWKASVFLPVLILASCGGRPLGLILKPYADYSDGLRVDPLSPGLHMEFLPMALGKYALTGTVVFSNTAPDTLRLHPDLGEFIVLDLATSKGTARVKKVTYDFWGLDFGSRIMVPCDSPIVLPPGGRYEHALDFSGRHFGVLGENGFNVQEGRFRLTRYDRFKVRYDSRYRFEKLPDYRGPLPNGGCYFCYNGNWGYSNFYKSKFTCDQLADAFEKVTCIQEKCAIPYDRLIGESDWVSFRDAPGLTRP